MTNSHRAALQHIKTSMLRVRLWQHMNRTLLGLLLANVEISKNDNLCCALCLNIYVFYHKWNTFMSLVCQVLLFKFENGSREVLLHIDSVGVPACTVVAIHPAEETCPFLVLQVCTCRNNINPYYWGSNWNPIGFIKNLNQLSQWFNYPLLRMYTELFQ